ncbi:6-O-methylguanine DNA methyltransferase [Melampsora americana]|nr:6-O-methylguanine DNA methyltransferase [Melampsora americana]
MSIQPDSSLAASTSLMSSLENESLVSSETIYPLTSLSRETYLTPQKKKVTAFQWKVYDLAIRIPLGKVTTYGILAQLLTSNASGVKKGGAQAVGNALRSNPFAPFVPCHRVINADLYIGGFLGDYGVSTTGPRSSSSSNKKRGVKQKSTTNHVYRKIELLKSEGICVGSDGTLLGITTDDLWRG